MSRGAIIAIVGSRKYADLDAVRRYVNSLPEDTMIVSGGAVGVDTVAEQAARARGLAVRIFPAKWTRPDGTYNKQAGLQRNVEIVEFADTVTAFWDGVSKGTKHTIDVARKQHKTVLINP